MSSRKTSILVVLLFILASMVVYRVVTKEEPKKVRELTYKPGAGGQGPVVGGEKIPPLNPPLIRFLGFLQKEGESKIFLSRDKEVFIVKKGDSVTIFQVADITDNSVTLLSRDSKEEFKLIIEDVKPTKPELMPGSGRR